MVWNSPTGWGKTLPFQVLWDSIEQRTALTSKFVKEYYEKCNPDTNQVEFIHRQRSKERFFCHTGENEDEGSSFRTIVASKQQIRLVILGLVWLCFQFWFYSLQANMLLYITLNKVDPENPSYPGSESKNGTNPFNHEPLYDIFFTVLPDLSYRPPWLKVGFVDLNVYVGQFMPWPLLLLAGKTEGFINYVGILGIINMLKGFIQLVTILPPARQGEACWLLNFSQEELDIVTTQPFFLWIWKDFPTFFTMGAARGCNDMLWSGHTAQTVLGWLFITDVLWRIWGRYRFRFVLYFLICLYLVCYMVAVLLCRMHYSIDVFCAVLISYFMYTHSKLRFRLWQIANYIACNDDKATTDVEYAKIDAFNTNNARVFET